jgi:hypothetical protein
VRRRQPRLLASDLWTMTAVGTLAAPITALAVATLPPLWALLAASDARCPHRLNLGASYGSWRWEPPDVASNRDRETSGPHGRISYPSLRSAARQAVHAAGAGFPSATGARIQHVGPELEDRRQSRSVRKLGLDVVRRVVRRLPEDGVALRGSFLGRAPPARQISSAS